MAAVKQQVLNWLYSVLTSEYHDITRSYGDVAQTLSHYSSLSPRTEVYTYENGKSALLLHLSGTLPVVFRGTTYRFPIALWIPHAYPLEPPLIYVVPTDGMMVRPGQHVDQQGKVYHPYLVGWAQYWDKSNILDFLAILREVFAKEPPVVSRQQQNPPPRPQSQAPPPIPPPPPGSVRSASISSLNGPPPPPPKPGSNAQQSPVGEPSRQDSGPPLPPLPPQLGNARYGQQSPTYNELGRNPQRTSSLRYETAPPLPLQPQRQRSLRRSLGGPVSPIPSPQAQSNQQQYQPLNSPNNSQPSHNPQQQFIRNNTVHQQPQWQQYSQQHPPQPQVKPPPPPDLMDGPLVLAVPSEASANLPAPPVPPNPEKDMLLHNIGRTLYAQRQHTRGLTASSLPGLESQRKAMLISLNSMQAEIQALESLINLLSSNTKILHTALHDADAVIDQSQHRTAPNIDELLVAPTVVGNQLYELVSEERSLGDALFVIGRAVEKGRITPAVFAKMTRTLAREWFLKKALVKKIGNGMGLATY
ncbi:related to component of actin cortical patches LAS17 [Rhynchosporium agropyri]|uniref:Related to component of actin cortical patches LAS17 n=1 Tax=Rhynchosporium agropyri TaxID=914238 RepID=A0A1E1KDK5_9HELO|nr:related to component of actin cortical patches LAS17 [Rhynchosporium agropyri]